MISKNAFLEKLNQLLKYPGMYGIQKVEDIRLIFTLEVFINGNADVGDWSNKFSLFVIEDTDTHLENFDWARVIRLYAANDSHSIELFKSLYSKFIAWESKDVSE